MSILLEQPLTPQAFAERLRTEGMQRYHHEHPFHRAMHEGYLTRHQLQCWVLNRYYYQTRIPIKDALILSKSDDPAFRRSWIHRIQDHDGTQEHEGGLALWRRLAQAVGLNDEDVRLAAHRTARCPACLRRLCVLRTGSAVGGSGRLFPDGTLCP